MARPEPNPHRDPALFGRVAIGGREVIALLVALDGVEIEDEWNVQRPVGSNGAVAVFKGTKIAESITLTLEAPDEESFDDLRDLWDLLAPKPGGTGSASATTTGSTYAIGVPSAKNAPSAGGTPAGSSGFSVPSGSGTGGNTTDNDGFPNNKPATNVGPRPPTLPIDNPLLAFIGVTAIARKKWKGPYNTETNSWRVDLTVIQNKPPTPAGVGQQSPAKGNQFTQGLTKSQVDNGPLGSAAAAV